MLFGEYLQSCVHTLEGLTVLVVRFKMYLLRLNYLPLCHRSVILPLCPFACSPSLLLFYFTQLLHLKGANLYAQKVVSLG